MKKVIYILLSAMLTNGAFAQSNEPCTAPALCTNNNNLAITGTIPTSANNDDVAPMYPVPASCTGGSGGAGGYITTAVSGGDVWYKVFLEQTPTAGNPLTIATSTDASLGDIAMAVYTATDACDPATFTQIACSRDRVTPSASNFPTVVLTSGTGGTYVYVRIWEEGQNATGTFNIQCDYTSTLDKINELDGLTTYIQPTSCPRYFYDDGGQGSTIQGTYNVTTCLTGAGSPVQPGDMGINGTGTTGNGTSTQYAGNQTYITTYCTTAGNVISADMGNALNNINGLNQMEIRADPNGNDYMTFYDGNSTAANPLGNYTGSTGSYPQPGIFVSTGQCLTIKWVADSNIDGIAYDDESGWGGTVTAIPAPTVQSTTTVTCGTPATFTDTGGAGGDYANNENYIKTFCSADGSALTATFAANAGLETNQDYLYVYDGADVSATLINAYTGGVHRNATCGNSGANIADHVNNLEAITTTVTNTTGCLTFRFTSSGATTKSGWSATIDCGEAREANGGENCANATTLILNKTHAVMNINAYGNPIASAGGGTPGQGGNTAGTADPALPLGSSTCGPTNTANDNLTRAENTLWYEFVMPNTPCPNPTFSVGLRNVSCQNIDTQGGGSGMQFYLFRTPGCQLAANWASSLVSCYDKITPTQPASGQLDITGTDITPGAHYFIMIDGFTGQHCNADLLTSFTAPDCSAPLVQSGSIGGNIFLDNFADGTEGNNDGLGTGTDAILNTTVTLYTCTVCDGTDNVAVPGRVITTTTGTYLFNNLPQLPAGQSYIVGFATPSGYTATGANLGGDGTMDSDNVSGFSQPISLTTSGAFPLGNNNGDDATSGFQNYTNVDAGFYQPINVAGVIQVDSAPETGATEGEAATPYLGGATVTLVMAGPDGIAGNSDDVTYTTTSSTVNGSFSFASENIPPGTIVSLSYTTPAGFDAILPENATTLTTNNTLATGNTSITAANICPTCTVNGTGVLAGSGSNPSTISDLGQNNFGLGILGSIAGTIFFDNFADGTTANNDGTGGGTDPVYNAAGGGVTLTLYDATTMLPVAGVAPIVTDATGNYAFTNLPAGQYYVVATLPAGYSQSPTNSNSNATPTEDSDFTTTTLQTPTITIGTAATVDPDFNGVLNITAPNANDVATGNVDYTQWDLGIYQPVTVTGTLYTQDGTGAFGAPAPNTPFTVTVTYTNSLGATSTVAIATTTDGNGDYSVTGFPPGNITSVTSTYGNIIATTVVCPTCPTTGSLQPSGSTLPLQNFSLPIELTAFTGKIEGTINHLYWITATEQNTKYHIIERSANGTTGFTEIGRVNAAGNSTSMIHYDLIDEKPLAQSYYRLRTIDNDGRSQVSNIILLTRKKGSFGMAQVYPVPATNQVTIAYEAPITGKLTIRVTDVLGKTVSQETIPVLQGFATKTMDISAFPVGVYMIILEDEASNRQTLEFIKQ